MHNEVANRSIRRPRKHVAARGKDAERRSRLRLRDLCDEVLASYRVARECDLWSADERVEAKRMLAGLAPRLSA